MRSKSICMVPQVSSTALTGGMSNEAKVMQAAIGLFFMAC